jgi:hypothetical protein
MINLAKISQTNSFPNFSCTHLVSYPKPFAVDSRISSDFVNSSTDWLFWIWWKIVVMSRISENWRIYKIFGIFLVIWKQTHFFVKQK